METAQYFDGVKQPILKVDTTYTKGKSIVIIPENNERIKGVKIDNVVEVYYPGELTEGQNRQNVIYSIDLRNAQVSATKYSNEGASQWKVTGYGPVTFDLSNPIFSIRGQKMESGVIEITAYDNKANILWERTAYDEVIFRHGEYSHVIDLETKEITKLFPILNRDYYGNMEKNFVIEFNGKIDSVYHRFGTEKEAATLSELEEKGVLNLPQVIKDKFVANYGDIPLRVDFEDINGEEVWSGYLPGSYDKPILKVGSIATAVILNDETVFTYTPEGYLISEENYLFEISQDVVGNLTQFVQEKGIKFKDRTDDFVEYFNKVVGDMDVAEIWVQVDANDNELYLVYDRRHRYTTLTIDGIRVTFGEEQDGEFWKLKSYIKNPIDVPVTTPPISLSKEKLDGEVVSREEIQGFPFLNASDFPQFLEKYIAYTESDIWYTYYQEPGDRFGRLIVQVSATDEGRYVYYVDEYNKDKVHEPTLAYLYFNPVDENGYSEEWIKIFTYKNQRLVDLDNLTTELNISKEELLEEAKDVLSFVKFHGNVKYADLTNEQKEQINNLEFVETKVIDEEGSEYLIYVVKGDSEGRIVLKHKEDELVNILIVNTDFFGYGTMAQKGYFQDLKTGDIVRFENKDMVGATVMIDGRIYELPVEEEPEYEKEVVDLHRVMFENPRTGELFFRWYPSYDPVGGRYELEEKGYFRVVDGKAKWFPISRTKVDEWSSTGEVPLNITYYEYDFTVDDLVEKYKGYTEGLVETNDPDIFESKNWNWDNSVRNLDRTEYLTNLEKNQQQLIFDGVQLRKLHIDYSNGAQENKYYSSHPFQDAYIIEKDMEVYVNLNWTSDDEGSFYVKTLVIDKQGLGVKAVLEADSEFIELSEKITPKFKEGYEKKFGRDFDVDFSFYQGIYGIENSLMRETKKIDFSLQGVKDFEAGIDTVNSSSREKPASYIYTFTKDITVKEIMTESPISKLADKTSVNMWWIRNSALFGVLPQSITFKEGEIEIREYKDKVNFIDWYDFEADRVENVSISELTQGRYEFVFMYEIQSDERQNLLTKEINLPSGTRLQEEYKYQKPRILNEFPVTRGFEAIQYNFSLSHSQPQAGFETEEKYRTKKWTSIDYTSQEFFHIVREKEGMAPNNEYDQKYNYDLFGIQKDKSRINIVSVWIGDLLAIKLLIWLIVPFTVFCFTLIIGRILRVLGERKREEERKIPEESLEKNISPIEVSENIRKVRDFLNELPDYGFEPGVIKVVKRYLEENIIEKLQQQTWQEFINEQFDGYGYRDFVENVLGEDAVKEEYEDNKLGIEDVYLWHCINRAANNFSHETPDFMSFMFWQGRKRARDGNSVGLFVEKQTKIWFEVNKAQIWDLKDVVPQEYYLTYDDINGLFRTKSFVEAYAARFEYKEYDNEYDSFIKELGAKKAAVMATAAKITLDLGQYKTIEITYKVLASEELADYRAFVFAHWKRDPAIEERVSRGMLIALDWIICRKGVSSLVNFVFFGFARKAHDKKIISDHEKRAYKQYSEEIKNKYIGRECLLRKTYPDKNGGVFGWKGWASFQAGSVLVL